MVSVALIVWALVLVGMSVLMWRRGRAVCPNCGALYVGSGQSAPTGEWVCSPDCVRGVVNGEASKRMWATHKTATGRLREPPWARNLPVPSQTSSGARGLSEGADGPGRAWLPVDYSQLELRMIASMGVSPELLNSDSTQFDMHRAVTEAVYRSDDG